MISFLLLLILAINIFTAFLAYKLYQSSVDTSHGVSDSPVNPTGDW